MKTEESLSTELALYLGLITDEKFRELMGISKRTERRWRQLGYFPYIRFRSITYYQIEDIRKALKDHFYRNEPIKNKR